MQDRLIPSSTQAPLRTHPARVQSFIIQAAGVCLLALVIGSLALVCSACRPTTTGPASVGISHPTATARLTLVAYHPGKSLGTIVYRTTLGEGAGFVYGLAWSPDSTRLDVSTATLVTAQSWVATTGKGVVNYGRAPGLAVVWSPDGQYVAVTGVNQGVQLYDARTGVLLKTYPDTVTFSLARAIAQVRPQILEREDMHLSEEIVLCDSPVARLYEQQAPALFAFLRQKTHSREDAEDILVEAFIAAIEHGGLDTLQES